MYDPQDVVNRYGQLSPRALQHVAEQAAQFPALHAGSGAYALTSLQQVLAVPLPEDAELFPPTVKVLLFTASGTWTKPPRLAFVEVQVQGGGGAAGTSNNDMGNDTSTAGGGGAGGFACARILADDLSATETVTVGAQGVANIAFGQGGAGGDSSFGSLCIAQGGIGGQATQGSGSTATARGGQGGRGTTGDIVLSGEDGGFGLGTNPGSALSPTDLLTTPGGYGGSSAFGGGRIYQGMPGIDGTLAAVGYGQGSPGIGIPPGSGPGPNVPDDGNPGVVIVREYYGIEP